MASSRISRRPELYLGQYVVPKVKIRVQSRISLVAVQRTRAASTLVSPIPAKYPDPSLYDKSALPPITRVPEAPKHLNQTSTVPPHLRNPDTLVTLYSFPSCQPLKLIHYPATHLNAPLRRDILHRAVIYEGDKERGWDMTWQPHRKEMTTSKRKLRPQKGGGVARVGDKHSPTRAGGARAFPIKPRDYATGLPKKLYDQAWRIALSLRYKKGELVVVDSLRHELMEDKKTLAVARFVEFFNGHSDGALEDRRLDQETRERIKRTLWLTEVEDKQLHKSLKMWYPKDRQECVDTVDVKNLLEGERIVIEQSALDKILGDHQSDLVPRVEGRPDNQDTSAQAAAMRQAAEETKALQEMMLEAALSEVSQEAPAPFKKKYSILQGLSQEEQGDAPVTSENAEAPEKKEV